MLKVYWQLALLPEKKTGGCDEGWESMDTSVFAGLERVISELSTVCQIWYHSDRTIQRKGVIYVKKWKERWILHLVDMWSGLTVSAFIDRKIPSEAINIFITNWDGAEFKAMEALTNNNCGEFRSYKVS